MYAVLIASGTSLRGSGGFGGPTVVTMSHSSEGLERTTTTSEAGRGGSFNSDRKAPRRVGIKASPVAARTRQTPVSKPLNNTRTTPAARRTTSLSSNTPSRNNATGLRSTPQVKGGSFSRVPSQRTPSTRNPPPSSSSRTPAASRLHGKPSFGSTSKPRTPLTQQSKNRTPNTQSRLTKNTPSKTPQSSKAGSTPSPKRLNQLSLSLSLSRSYI